LEASSLSSKLSEKVSNIFRKMKINGKETERFENLTHAVDWVVEKKQCSRQEATHFVWDNQFTMGTDRAIWLTI
jgi:hypothetical protein